MEPNPPVPEPREGQSHFRPLPVQARQAQPILEQPNRSVPPSQKETRSRLVVVETVYHQSPNEQPTTVESRFAKWLETDEQPYGPRKGKVDSADWQNIDSGWIEQASVMVLHCLTGKIDYGIASAEGRDAIVLPASYVPAGASIRIFPPTLHLARIRGYGTYKLTLMPE